MNRRDRKCESTRRNAVGGLPFRSARRPCTATRFVPRNCASVCTALLLPMVVSRQRGSCSIVSSVVVPVVWVRVCALMGRGACGDTRLCGVWPGVACAHSP